MALNLSNSSNLEQLALKGLRRLCFFYDIKVERSRRCSCRVLSTVLKRNCLKLQTQHLVASHPGGGIGVWFTLPTSFHQLKLLRYKPGTSAGRRFIHWLSFTGFVLPDTNHSTRAVTSLVTAGKSAEHVIARVTSRSDVTTSGCILARGIGTTDMLRLLFATYIPP